MERDAKTLKIVLENIDKFIKKLGELIKDEIMAQEMYAGMATDITQITRFETSVTGINLKISGISRDERRHEGELKQILTQVQGVKQHVKQELNRREEEDRKKIHEEERKKSQQAKGPHTRYGRR